MDMGEDDRAPLIATHEEDEDEVVVGRAAEALVRQPDKIEKLVEAQARKVAERASGGKGAQTVLLNSEYDQWSKAQAPAMVFREEDDA